MLLAGDDLDVEHFDAPDDRGEGHSDWSNTSACVTWSRAQGTDVQVATLGSLNSRARRRTGEALDAGSAENADLARVDDRGDLDFLTVHRDWHAGLADRLLLEFGGQLRRGHARFDYRRETGREFDRGDDTRGLDVDTLDVDLTRSTTEAAAYVAARCARSWISSTSTAGRTSARSSTRSGSRRDAWWHDRGRRAPVPAIVRGHLGLPALRAATPPALRSCAPALRAP